MVAQNEILRYRKFAIVIAIGSCAVVQYTQLMHHTHTFVYSCIRPEPLVVGLSREHIGVYLGSFHNHSSPTLNLLPFTWVSWSMKWSSLILIWNNGLILQNIERMPLAWRPHTYCRRAVMKRTLYVLYFASFQLGFFCPGPDCNNYVSPRIPLHSIKQNKVENLSWLYVRLLCPSVGASGGLIFPLILLCPPCSPRELSGLLVLLHEVLDVKNLLHRY